MPYYVHVFALCSPRYSLTYVVNYLKGKSARKILQRFPELKTRAIHGNCVAETNFVAIGNVTADIIRKYVEKQRRKER
jgi:putative transposase